MARAFFFEPTGDGEVPETPSPDSTAAYGAYIATSVANCKGCHTNRDLMTGAFIGPDFAGPMAFEVLGEKGEIVKGKHIVAPNLTPEVETGRIANWSQQMFIDRFRAGRAIAGSPMPWGPFSRMSNLELAAIYKYLRTLNPVVSPTPPGIQEGDPPPYPPSQ